MQHHFILRYLRRHYHPSTTTTTTSIIPSITCVRDRALDHAVEKERHLKPIINLKNLINQQPSKTLPLSIITHQRSSLSIPIRPIDFIRKYPSLFQEFLPAGININIHPHIKLTPEILALDAEEHILFSSEMHKQDVANRLLKLLMLGRVNRIPLSVIDQFKWDLGLPNDYVESLVPHFPHYFRVVSNSNSNSNDSELELVCWNDELAVSDMEAKGLSEFRVQYSRGFELDKKFKKWVDEWQKLPYVSPYENVMSLGAKSEETDKWIVGLMHEVLNILVPKKTEKDNLLFFGEYLGVRSRFKKALLEHPGIFYVSSKLRTHTVVLREGYKRDLLVEKVRHPVMKLRGSYIHLMNMVKEKSKSNDAEVGEKKQKRARDLDGEDDELSDDVSEAEEEDDDETEGDDYDDGESEDLEEMQRTPTNRRTSEGRKIPDQRSRMRRSDDNDQSEDLEEMQRTHTKKTNLEGRKNPDQRSRRRRSDDSDESEDLEEIQRTPTKRAAFEGRKNPDQRSRTRRSNNDESEHLDNGNTKIRGRTIRTGKFNDSNRRTPPNSRVNVNDGRRGRGNDRRYAFDEKSDSRTNQMSDRRVGKETNPPRFLRTEAPGARASRDRSYERSSVSRTREGRSSERGGVPRMREGRSSERPGFSRTREGRSSERPSVSRAREGRSSERSHVSRTREGRF